MKKKLPQQYERMSGGVSVSTAEKYICTACSGEKLSALERI